jgi:AcrR family transcriptional regulator
VASSRRVAGPNGKNRAVLLDAAERLMRSEGYAAVTSRRVAEEAGLKPQLVHYYFRTMDDLFLAVYRRRADEGIARLSQALASDRPLRALWAQATDTRGNALTVEFTALANHRKPIRAEMARYAERFRREQAAALDGLLPHADGRGDALTPLVVSVMLTSMSVVLVMEQALGVDVGHPETMAVVEAYLDRVEPLTTASATRSRSALTLAP